MANLGIDLGTYNSAGALFIGEQCEAVEPEEGSIDGACIVPSFVQFSPGGALINVGKGAHMALRNPGAIVVGGIKRWMGKSYDEVLALKGGVIQDVFGGTLVGGPQGRACVKVGERILRPEEIAAEVLRKLRRDAEIRARAVGERIAHVVVTVPAAYPDPAVKATLEAARLAFPEYEVDKGLALVEEPMAAAMTSTTPGPGDEVVLVFDMGAGTTDVVVMSISSIDEGEPHRHLIHRACNDRLGGLDMDESILNSLLDSDKKEPVLRSLLQHMPPHEVNGLRYDVEKAKIAASSGHGEFTRILEVPWNGTTAHKIVNLELSRATLEHRIAKIVAESRSLLEAVLLRMGDNDPSRLGKVRGQITRILLVGGPTRMGLLRRTIEEVCGIGGDCRATLHPTIEDALDPYPMHAVALGAARMSRLLAKGTSRRKISTTVPYTIGLFKWFEGYVPILPAQTPFAVEAHAEATLQVPVHAGREFLYVVNEKGPAHLYPAVAYPFYVPESTTLKVTGRYSQTGASFEIGPGQGLPVPIRVTMAGGEFAHQTTMGQAIGRSVRGYLGLVRDVPTKLEEHKLQVEIKYMKQVLAKFPHLEAGQIQTREQLRMWLARFKVDDVPIVAMIDRKFDLPRTELEHCSKLEVDQLSQLSDAQVRLALESGYLLARRGWCRTWGVSEKMQELVQLLYEAYEEPGDLDALASCVRDLVARACAVGHRTHAAEMLEVLSAKLPGDSATQAEAWNTMNIVVIEMYHAGILSAEERDRFLGVSVPRS